MDELALKLGAEFVIGADGVNAFEQIKTWDIDCKVSLLKSRGLQEEIQDKAIATAIGNFILLLDDDELASPAMEQWLERKDYEEHDHWKFPRMNLWPTVNSVLMEPPLFPDHQVRLSSREKAGGRRFIHDTSPYPDSLLAPVAIEHHKFLVKLYSERRSIAERYDKFAKGFGTGYFLPFSLPELAYRDRDVLTVEKGDGTVPWTPIWEQMTRMLCPCL